MSVETRTPYRVLVTGSRDWTDGSAVRVALDRVLAERGSFTLVHGAHWTGADAIAEAWWYANRDQVAVERHRAEWTNYGNAAGPIRNAAMAAAGADQCLAFIVAAPGKSCGTLDCVYRAEQRGIPVDRYVQQPERIA